MSYSSWSEAEEPDAVEAAEGGDCASARRLLLKALEAELHEGECIDPEEAKVEAEFKVGFYTVDIHSDDVKTA